MLRKQYAARKHRQDRDKRRLETWTEEDWKRYEARRRTNTSRRRHRTRKLKKMVAEAAPPPEEE
jgi:hypothetical protein